MTFKEKHFKQAFGPFMLAALMMLPAGCGKAGKWTNSGDDGMGLLSPNPVDTVDKYGVNVSLRHVQIPVYDKDGNRLKDRWILTYGLPNTQYSPDVSKSTIQEVCLNKNPKTCFVRIDRNNAVLTDFGGCGLFVENSKVVIVSDARIDDFVGELNVKVSRSQVHPAKVNHAEKAENEPQNNVVEADSLKVDTLQKSVDTLTSAPMIKFESDSSGINR